MRFRGPQALNRQIGKQNDRHSDDAEIRWGKQSYDDQ